MKLVWCVLSVLITFAAADDESSKFIVGGRDAHIEDYPHMAGIMNFGVALCGGAIVNERSVLTAAHCIIIGPAVSIFVGTSRRTAEGGQTHRALRVFSHPNYKMNVFPDFYIRNDIAVIRTITSIRFGRLVQPIPLGTQFVSSGTQVMLSGWGNIGDSIRDRADQLQKLELTSISNIRCSLQLRGTIGEGLITSEMLCLTTNDSAGVCQGDSGSPIISNGAVVGVVSWMAGPCGSDPSMMVRVAHHINWIRQQI